LRFSSPLKDPTNMDDSSTRNQLEVLINETRRSPSGVSAFAVALGARKLGLSIQQSLRAAQRAEGPYSLMSSINTSILDAAAEFCVRFCIDSNADAIAEYFAIADLLTANLIDGPARRKVTFVTGNREFANSISELLSGTGARCEELSTMSKSEPYDVIIAWPAMGGSKVSSGADGFGGEVVMELLPLLKEQGTLIWLTGRAVLWSKQSSKTFSDLANLGVFTLGTVESPPGLILGANIASVMLLLSRRKPEKRFIATMRSVADAKVVGAAFLQGPTRRNSGPGWSWLDLGDNRRYSDLENEAALERIAPKGRYTMVPLGSLLSAVEILKADPAIQAREGDLFIPEYAASTVTDSLEAQTVKPTAVYHFNIDTTKAIPRFLAGVLNSKYGRLIRENAASGATIQRLSKTVLLQLMVPVPELRLQRQIGGVDSDLKLLRSALKDLSDDAERNWKGIQEIARTVEQLKSVIDIDRQIETWWRELPYPLASVYRRYQTSLDPKDKLDALLLFFEMAAIYLAMTGCSYIKALRPDWQEKLGLWLHPTGGAGIEHADFGFWIGLCGASLKDTSRVYSDPEDRSHGAEMAGGELANSANEVGSLSRATDPLHDARKYRNSKAHGGHIKSTDAERILADLRETVSRLYEIAAPVFRRMYLVRPGSAQVSDTGITYACEILVGSDPQFERRAITLDKTSVRSGALAFWMRESRAMCQALPFLRMGASREPQENSIYAFNRLENGRMRWISYQEAREQEIFVSDDELSKIIELRKPGV
jgi:hypothetical protein